MWRWWLSITECHGIVKKGYMVYEIWGPDTIAARWNIQLHHLSRDWSLGWLKPPPSWQHNLIYIPCNGNYEEKNTRPFQANMVSVHLYIIKSIPFPNWTLPSRRAEWCCSLRIAFNASRQELRTIQELCDFISFGYSRLSTILFVWSSVLPDHNSVQIILCTLHPCSHCQLDMCITIMYLSSMTLRVIAITTSLFPLSLCCKMESDNNIPSSRMT